MTTPNAAFSETVSEAFANVLAKQPGVVRRKDSLNLAAGTFLQVSSLLTTVSAGLPLWASAIISVIIGVVQVVFTATTEGAVTPSQERKIVAEISKLERPELKKAGALNTLLNIFDAVEIEREKERSLNEYGKEAISEVRTPEKREEDIEVAPEPETVLDKIRNQVADHTTE